MEDPVIHKLDQNLPRVGNCRERQMTNHLNVKKIEEFFGNLIRYVHYFFIDSWSKLHIGSC